MGGALTRLMGQAGAASTNAAYVGGKAVAISNTGTENVVLTDLTGGSNSAPSAGDLVVITFEVAGPSTTSVIPKPTNRNYVLVASQPTSGTTSCVSATYMKFMGASPDTSVDLSGVISSGNGGAIAIEVWRGVDLRMPLDVATVTASGSTAQPNPPSITPTTTGAVVVAWGFAAIATGAALTSSDLTAFNNYWDADTTDAMVGMGYVNWTSGAVNPAQFGGGSSSSAGSWGAGCLALRPGSSAKFSGPISFVGAKTFSMATTGGSVSLTDLLTTGGGAATILQGDLIIVSINRGGTSSATQHIMTPTGFTPIHDPIYANDNADADLQVSMKFMGSTPDTSFTVGAIGGSNTEIQGTVHAIRGVDIVDPLDVAVVTTSGINSGIPDAPAITPATSGAWIMTFGAAAGDGTFTALTNPSGMSGTTNHFQSVANTTSLIRSTTGAAIYTGWASGAYDPATFGGGSSGTGASWAAVTIALRPGP